MAETPARGAGRGGSGAPGGSLTGRTLSGLKWAGLSAAAQGVASLAILAVLSRLLTPADFGVLAMALVFVTAAQVLGHRSLGSAIVQRHELGDRHVAAALTLSSAAGAALAGALWLLAPALGRLLAEPAVAPALGALTLAIAISGPATVPEFLLRRQLRFRALAAAELLSQVLGYGLVAIALAAHGFGVWALVWGAVARQGVFAAAVLAAAPRLPRPGLARRETGEVLRAGAGFSSIALFDLVAHQGSRLVVGRLLGAASLGHYTRATALAVFAGHPGQIVTRVLFPAMAQRQHRTDRLGAVYLHGTECLALLALPASLMLAVSAPEIVAVVLGAQWDAAVPVLQVLGAGAAFRVGGLLNTPVTRAMGALRRVTWRVAVYAGLLLAGIAAGSRWGLPGVAAAAVLAFAVSWAMMTQLALSLLGLGWPHLLRRLVPALWAGAWAAPALWLTAVLVRDAGLPAAAALAAEAAACLLAAALAVLCAPRLARPAFPAWALAQLPFDTMGRPGRWLRFALTLLAHRYDR